MRTARRNRAATVLITTVIIGVLIALAVSLLRGGKEEPDPHAGQVYLNDGFGMVWMTPLEGVEASDLDRSQFISHDGRPSYTGAGYETKYGVDVSEHQWGVDWNQVRRSGVDFAMIRIGYRGYTEGGLFTDPHFENNLRGVVENDIDAGCYFFSQAITVQEAIEEANYVIDALKGRSLSLPIFFDWEKIEDAAYARTDGLSSQTLTDCAVAFCSTIRSAGYDAGVYFNRHLGYYDYDISRLTDYMFWLALPGEFPDFYYKTAMWQYSFTATVPGIDGETDMNMLFIPVETPAPEATESK